MALEQAGKGSLLSVVALRRLELQEKQCGSQVMAGKIYHDGSILGLYEESVPAGASRQLTHPSPMWMWWEGRPGALPSHSSKRAA